MHFGHLTDDELVRHCVHQPIVGSPEEELVRRVVFDEFGRDEQNAELDAMNEKISELESTIEERDATIADLKGIIAEARETLSESETTTA